MIYPHLPSNQPTHLPNPPALQPFLAQVQDPREHFAVQGGSGPQAPTRTSEWVYGFLFAAVSIETFISLAQNASPLPGITPETCQSDELP